MARIGEAYKPQSRTPTREISRIKPCAPWQYAHHPTAWGVFDGHLMPLLTQMTIAPGVHHIGADLDLGEMYQRFKGNGWTFLPYEFGSDDEDDSYLRKIEVIGGHAYIPVFVRPIMGTDKTIRDDAAWLAFLKAVKKHVAPPAAWVLEKLRKQNEQVLAEISINADRNPAAARHRDRLAADLKVIEKELTAAIKRDAPPIKKGGKVRIDGPVD